MSIFLAVRILFCSLLSFNNCKFTKTLHTKFAYICTSKDIYGSYTIDYTLAQVKLLVDFSVILYNTINTDIEVCPEDISNLDIYALEETSFIDEPFDFCYFSYIVEMYPNNLK